MNKLTVPFPRTNDMKNSFGKNGSCFVFVLLLRKLAYKPHIRGRILFNLAHDNEAWQVNLHNLHKDKRIMN